MQDVSHIPRSFPLRWGKLGNEATRYIDVDH